MGSQSKPIIARTSSGCMSRRRAKTCGALSHGRKKTRRANRQQTILKKLRERNETRVRLNLNNLPANERRKSRREHAGRCGGFFQFSEAPGKSQQIAVAQLLSPEQEDEMIQPGPAYFRHALVVERLHVPALYLGTYCWRHGAYVDPAISAEWAWRFSLPSCTSPSAIPD